MHRQRVNSPLTRTSCLLALTTSLASAQQPLESPHVAGPHGLSGWTIRQILPGAESQGPLPVQLVLARDGRVIRRINGDLLLWKWIFLPDGNSVAYETGPLHFSLTCERRDIRTGHLRGRFDCYADPLPATAPAWVKELEAHPTPSAQLP